MKIAPFVVALAFGFAAGASVAQEDPAAMTCAHYSALPVDEQVVALSTLEPLGDEMNTSDIEASKQWAAQVTAACRDRPDALLSVAAEDALGE